jgi:hypothetical protein
MATLQEIQAKLLEQAKGNQERPQGATSGDNASFPFWNTPEGQSSVIRFLPDGDTDNTFFWQERQIIKLPFAGVVGRDDNPCEVQVPCVDMFGDQCPITAAIRPWWKDESKKDLARVYYKKRSYLFQGFVVNSAFEEPQLPENPIRRFIINPSIYEIIKNSLMNPEMEDLPTDYVGGRDFKLTKTKKGDYANYGTSQWSFKVRGLNADELGAIEQYGLFNLKEFLGNRPDRDGIEMIRAMFEDSLAGRPFDTASYGSVYRASGSFNKGGATAPAAAPAASYSRAPAARQDDEEVDSYTPPARQEAPAAPAATGGAKPNAQDILARIKARTGN